MWRTENRSSRKSIDSSTSGKRHGSDGNATIIISPTNRWIAAINDCESLKWISKPARARNIIDEKSATFIWTAHTENLNLTYVNWLEKSDEIIYASEMDGWRHLYLVDVKEGKIKNQITKGEWVVRGIDRIDEDKRQIWFRASGKNPDQDPYFVHCYRVNFDGTDS